MLLAILNVAAVMYIPWYIFSRFLFIKHTMEIQDDPIDSATVIFMTPLVGELAVLLAIAFDQQT